MTEEKCCVVSCEKPLDQNYWNSQYQAHTTGWDLGEVSPPIKSYLEKLQKKDVSILIPGCGNAYEAEYLLSEGFTNITIIDFAPKLVENLKNKYVHNESISVILGDFFELQGSYDLILEQTFFCALPPFMRQKYVWKMHQLLADNGVLAGLLFNRDFDVSPPCGGSQNEYELLFKDAFTFKKLNVATNSIVKREGTELAFEFQKNNKFQVHLYDFEGISCSGCKSTVTAKFNTLDGVKNVSMSTDFSQVLIVSNNEIDVQVLQEMISYDEDYKIVKH